MRGSVVRKGSGWTARWDEPGADGKRRQRRKGGFPTRREAQTHLNEQLQRLSDGSYASPSKVTVAGYLAEWLDAQEGRLRPLSATQYRGVVRRYIEPRIGSVRLQELSARQLGSFYRQLERDGLSASTRKLVHAVLRRALGDAVREGDLPRVLPAGSGRRPPVPRESKRGRRPSSSASSTTSPRTGSSRCGGWRPPPGCAAANLPDSPGAGSISTAPGSRSSSSSSRPAAV